MKKRSKKVAQSFLLLGYVCYNELAEFLSATRHLYRLETVRCRACLNDVKRRLGILLEELHLQDAHKDINLLPDCN